jgi:ribonucleoside-triphosphate reductase
MSNNNTLKTITPFVQRFNLDNNTKQELKSMTPEFGFNGLGEVVFRRTYSRDNEDWADVVTRVVQGAISIRKEHYARNSLRWIDSEWQSFARDMAVSLFKMEWLPPGRGLWMMGTDFVYKRGSMALNNCFKRDTTFWTDKGLKSFEDFEHGDSVVIRGKNTWKKATIQCFGEQEIVELTVANNEKLVTIKTTANHRWLAKNYTEYRNNGNITSDKKEMNKTHVNELFGSEQHTIRSPCPLEPTRDSEWCIQPVKNKEDVRHAFHITTTDKLEVNSKLQNFEKLKHFNSRSICNIGIQHGIVYARQIYDGVSTAFDKTKYTDYQTPGKVGATATFPSICTIGSQHGIVHARQLYNGVSTALDEIKYTDYQTPGKVGATATFPNTWISLPSVDMNDDYTLGFLAGVFSKVGYFDDRNYLVISCDELCILEWIRDAFFKFDIQCESIDIVDIKTTGYATITELYNPKPKNTLYIIPDNIPSKFFIRESQLNEFSPTKDTLSWRVVDVKSTGVFEKVWCVVEPSKEEFTLECGILTKNCGAFDTDKDITQAAEWTMDALMNGVGVGFSTSWRGEATKPDKSDFETFVIPDSREGWVESLIRLMGGYIDSPLHGKNKFTKFDYSVIRPAGLPIKGFGGQSSGYEPLEKMHRRIEGYLDAFCDRELTVPASEATDWSPATQEVKKPYSHTRLCADIFNSIGACVVAGNVRRSAEIALGDVNDDDFINLKNYTDNPERSEIGWMSNNSVRLTADDGFEDFSYIPEMAKRIVDNGEPGLINLYNIQKYGRYGKASPDEATMCNPCGEIPLLSGELCNLAEVFPHRCNDVDVFNQSLKYATFYSTSVSLLPTHRPETNAVIAKNRRIGVSISGIAQWVSGAAPASWGLMNYTRLTRILREGYNIVRSENTRLANEAGVPASIRVTTIKPSGSISLLAGATAGVHYPISRYAIRRMRIGNDSPLVPALIEAKIPHEPDTYSDNTLVFEFAIDHGDVRPVEEVSPWEQFSLVAMLQRCWADNMVSATVYFDKVKDAPDVEKMLAMFIPVLKSVSMLPHSGHGYSQAPYEPITFEQYEKRLAGYNKPKFAEVKGSVPTGSKFCDGDTCEL